MVRSSARGRLTRSFCCALSTVTHSRSSARTRSSATAAAASSFASVQPHAAHVTVLIAGREIPAERIESGGVFEALLPAEISAASFAARLPPARALE